MQDGNLPNRVCGNQCSLTKLKLSPDSKHKCQANTGQQGTNNESHDQSYHF